MYLNLALNFSVVPNLPDPATDSFRVGQPLLLEPQYNHLSEINSRTNPASYPVLVLI